MCTQGAASDEQLRCHAFDAMAPAYLQERRDRLMRRKERLLGQIAEVEARLGIGTAPALSASGSDGTPGRATSPRRQLPPLSPLSPPVPRGGKPVVNEVDMLQQVRPRALTVPMSCRRSAAVADYQAHGAVCADDDRYCRDERNGLMTNWRSTVVPITHSLPQSA